MAKVKDEASVKSANAASKGGSAKKPGRLGPFFLNLFRTDVFKPTQGKSARLWTAVGFGVMLAAGLYRVYDLYLHNQYAPVARMGIPAVIGVVMVWIVWRVIQFPPFADFLIGTEAEMRKVSWTTPEALKRATIVVLATIFLMAFYLLAVDQIWIMILQLLRVLRISSSDLGSQ